MNADLFIGFSLLQLQCLLVQSSVFTSIHFVYEWFTPFSTIHIPTFPTFNRYQPVFIVTCIYVCIKIFTLLSNTRYYSIRRICVKIDFVSSLLDLILSYVVFDMFGLNGENRFKWKNVRFYYYSVIVFMDKIKILNNKWWKYEIRESVANKNKYSH